MERGKILTVPNSISLSRLLLAVAFVAVSGRPQRLVLILAATATDFLDGWAARKSNAATVAGALIDPFADRVFVLAAISSYLLEGSVSRAEYFVFLSRDIATAVGFVVARFIPGLSAASFQARILGKTVTSLQLTMLITVLVAPRFVQPLILVIAAVSAVSIVDYTVALERARRRARNALSS